MQTCVEKKTPGFDDGDDLKGSRQNMRIRKKRANLRKNTANVHHGKIRK
jgi:hypothetical protein